MVKRSDHVSAGMPVEDGTYENDLHPELNKPCELLGTECIFGLMAKLILDSDYKSYLSYGNATDDTIKKIWKSKKFMKYETII